jgi:hypothetical protein
METAVKDVSNGRKPKAALAEIGAQAVALMQKEVTDGGFAPNAPATTARKGSDMPLIDTGQMRQSVHYQIRKKRG